MILKFVEGPLCDNNYLLYNETTKNALLIDCTNPSPAIDEAIDLNNLNLTAILLTHGHFDHILGVNYYRKKYGAKAFIHKNDEPMVTNINSYMAFLGRYDNYEVPIIDGFLENEFSLDDEIIKVIHTPGHSKGSVCFLYNDKLFTGDTLFLESYGRTDLPSGSFEELKQSLSSLFTLDENLKVLPGHGDDTTIKHEKQNYYL